MATSCYCPYVPFQQYHKSFRLCRVIEDVTIANVDVWLIHLRVAVCAFAFSFRMDLYIVATITNWFLYRVLLCFSLSYLSAYGLACDLLVACVCSWLYMLD